MTELWEVTTFALPEGTCAGARSLTRRKLIVTCASSPWRTWNGFHTSLTLPTEEYTTHWGCADG